MKDRSLGIWLMVLFGGSGLAAVALGWLLPGLHSERLPATLVGLVGITFAAVRGLMLRRDRLALSVAENEK